MNSFLRDSIGWWVVGLATAWTMLVATSLKWNVAIDRHVIEELAAVALRSTDPRDARYRDPDVLGLPIARSEFAFHAIAWGLGLCVLSAAVLSLRQRRRERDATEATLRQSEARFRSFVEQAGDGFELLDADGQLVDCNSAACRQLGYSRDELLGLALTDINPEITAERYAERLRSRVGRQPETFDTVHRRKDGTIFPVEVTTSAVRVGERLCALSLVRDITERRRIQEELDAGKRELEHFFGLVPDLVCIASTDGYFKKLGGAWEQTLGFSHEELLAQPFESFIHPEDLEPTLQQIFSGRSTVNFVNRYRTSAGGYRWLEWMASPPVYGSMLYAAARDITARKQAEEAVGEAEHLMQTRLRLMELSATHSLEELLVATLDEAEALTGSQVGFYHYLESDQKTLSLQAWSTRTTREMCLAEGKGRHYDIAEAGVWVDCIRQRGPVIHNDCASQCHRKGLPPGHTAVVRELAVPVFRDDQIVAVLGVGNKPTNYLTADVQAVTRLADLAWDIAARKRTELELCRLRDCFANTIDSMPSMIVGIGPNGRVTQWNRQAAAHTGLSAVDALQRPATEVLPDFAVSIDRLRMRVQHAGPALAQGVPVVDRDGERRLFDVMLYSLSTDSIGDVVVRIEDVTERWRVQELIIQTEKMMSVGGLAAGMAHEINNPLGIIMQALENIERRASADLPANREAAASAGTSLEAVRTYYESREIPAFIRDIREASGRAAAIVANTLAFSRKSDPGRSPADLSGLIDQSVLLAGGNLDLEKHGDFRAVDIVRHYDANVPPVPVSAVEIQQVFLNLLTNAAQAMAANPPDRRPQIALRLFREERFAVAQVRDNGPGIEPAALRRVFEPFFTTKPPGVGTGLGLSVAYTIVTQNHGGLLEVESSPGAGACFTVRLPLPTGGS